MAGQVFLHVLKERLNDLLRILDLLLEGHFLLLELLSEVIDFLFLLVKNLEFLGVLVAFRLGIARQIVFNVANRLGVSFHDLARVGQFLLLHLNLGVVLLNTVHEALASLGKRQVHLVGLQLEVLLALRELGLLVAEMLRALLEGIGAETHLSLGEAAVDLLELLALLVDVGHEALVIGLELLVFVALLGVQVVQLGFVGVVNFLNLLLVRLNLVLHVALLREEGVEVLALLVVLVLDVDVERFDVFGLSVGAVLVEGQVVVGEFAFVAAHIFDEGLVLALQREVGVVVLVDVFDLLLHLGNLGHNVVVLALQQVRVVVLVVDLAPRTRCLLAHAHHSVVRDGSVNAVDFGVVANAGEVDFALRSALARSSALPHTHGGAHPVIGHIQI